MSGYGRSGGLVSRQPLNCCAAVAQALAGCRSSMHGCARSVVCIDRRVRSARMICGFRSIAPPGPAYKMCRYRVETTGPMAKSWQQPLPEIYTQLSDAELRLRIESAKEFLGSRLAVLGHHYQQDAVIDFADFTGDSFELSRKAAEQTGIQYVVFCGVHFMAESADILTDESVRVILPDMGAGCSMADMANLEQTLDCWAQLQEECPDQTIVPITYMNSSAAIKAFVGENGGAVCTSSNCRNVLEWALAGGANQQSQIANRKSQIKILFFPDQHLGRNTAYAMGYPLDKMVVWDPREELGGNDPKSLRDADFVLWKGHCSVHALFRP